MLAEQPPQVPLSDAQPAGQAVDVAFIERPRLDQRQRPADRI